MTLFLVGVISNAGPKEIVLKSILRLIPSFSILILMLLVPLDAQDFPYSVLTRQTVAVLCTAFNPLDNNMLACGLSDGRIQVWDTSTHTLQYILYEYRDLIFSLAFSPDGSTLASGNADGTLRLWSVDTGKLRILLNEHTALVTSLTFSADGSTLASGSADGTIRLWNPDTGDRKKVLQGYEVPVASLAFSPTENILASGRADNIIRLWDLDKGVVLHTLRGHTDPVLSLAFNDNGNMLASGGADKTVRLWDTGTKSLQHTLTNHTDWVNSVAFNGTTLASGSHDKMIRLWDANTGALQRTLTAHTSSVESVAFSANGNMLASGSAGGSVLLWELTPSQIMVDVNRDGFVNRLDLEQVNSLLGMMGPNRADVSGDDIVDIADLVLVANAIGDTAADRNALASGRTDVNDDGDVDMLDLEAVDRHLGETGQYPEDVNIDGVVNIVDLVLVANAIGPAGASPSLHNRGIGVITAERVQGWLTEARLAAETSLAYQRGMLVLEHLLATLTPKVTVLLPNYPNPFNPETWIPYRLGASVDVTVTIYAANGMPVRALQVGHQPAGNYQSRGRAAYWDGRNTQGEPVASGLYFYTLTAGEFTATRKMLIRK